MHTTVKGYKIQVNEGLNALTYKNQVNITKDNENSMFLFDSRWLAEDFAIFALEIITESENFRLKQFTKEMDGQYFYTPTMVVPGGRYYGKPKQLAGVNGPYWGYR